MTPTKTLVKIEIDPGTGQYSPAQFSNGVLEIICQEADMAAVYDDYGYLASNNFSIIKSVWEASQFAQDIQQYSQLIEQDIDISQYETVQ